MNLEDLRAAQVDERGTDSLQPLRPTFYEDAAAYLSDIRERRNRLAEQVDDPLDSEEVRQLNDELKTAEEVVEALYERRVGKLVKQASLAAAGMSTDEDGLTEEERTLFTDLVERIETNRAEVLDALEGETAVPEAPATDAAGEADPRPVDDTPDDELDAASAMGSTEPDTDDPPEPSTPPDAENEPEPDGGAAIVVTDDSEAADRDRMTVRITASVGEIYGVDERVYTLDSEDVVTLPAPNAKPLLDRGAAQRVD